MYSFSIYSSTARGHRKFHAWIILFILIKIIQISALFLFKKKVHKKALILIEIMVKMIKNKHKNLSLSFNNEKYRKKI